ncbi:PREDICTED: protein FAR-RED IMPAIRED RESPONSE 1-like [Nelumbo nucifera]|uniref:Protein FAR1-RELATED SEQUENCE n=2 Tax=Nelumbo nucifera TaxID=4432 RepID=A0A1U7ZL91_NELNU|nr:PREDICTED: protein FAR-RED IMPAIRED RESPONSE 1-like [Nelumbo nucifera]DAD30440.1 TPA_asm: hypothetical protein HUJ06_009291 [Nelumbo nucifera]
MSGIDFGMNFPTMDLAFTEQGAIFEPYKGMEFDSHEEAYSFYEEYANCLGFTTMKKNTSRSKRTGLFIDAYFACYRYGNKQPKHEVLKPRPSHRTDCKASMHVKRRQDGKWFVHNFVKEHNHVLLPAQAYHFRSRTRMDAISKKHLEFLHAGPVQTNKTSGLISSQCGGDQSIVWMEKFVRDQMDKKTCLAIKSEDTQALLDYFIHMQEENTNFFYVVDLNDEQRLKNVFWVDAKGRHDYFNFGDVISIDTTFLAKGYNLPFAPFIGVNHQCDPILLGCALLADTTTSTFVWLMRMWLRAMGGVTPKIIVTDRDNVLNAAVAEVFPNVCHRFCLGNVLKDISENLDHITKRSENFMEEFKKCIYNSWTEEEFETQWWKMIHAFELVEDDWVKSLYEDRKHWVPVSMKNTSYVGLSTAQRLESINSFFDNYVHKETTLKEILVQFKVVHLQDRHGEESRENPDTWVPMPPLKSHSPYEKQMYTIYTCEIFKKFQVEVLGTVACHPRKEKQDGSNIIFRVHDFESQEEFTVAWDETKAEVSCQCCLFEHKGFLCRHAMVVLQCSAVNEIPSKYILKQWTDDAERRHTIGHRSDEVGSRAERCNDLCHRALKLGIEASISEESYSIAVHAIQEAIGKCAITNNSIK